jgi:hypothetical protein
MAGKLQGIPMESVIYPRKGTFQPPPPNAEFLSAKDPKTSRGFNKFSKNENMWLNGDF